MRTPAISSLARSRRSRCVLGVCVLGLCLTARAEGQMPDPTAQGMGGGSAIFGGAEARGLPARDGRTLDLLMQVFGGYDDDVLAEQSSRGPSQDRLASAAAGLATGIGAAISYSHPGLLFKRPDRVGDFRLFLDNSIRYYPGLDNLTGRYHRFGMQVSAPVTRRLTLFLSPRADYAPRYSFELLRSPILSTDPEGPQTIAISGPEAAPDIDYSVVANNSLRYGAVGGAELDVGTRSSISFDAGYTRRRSSLVAYDMEVRNVGLSFNHKFTQNAAVELGYEYVDGDHGSGFATRAHNIDVGIDYRRPLSRTRKTFIAFNTGSTIVENELAGRRVQAIGSASLVHYMKRTWTALAEYRRRVHYVDGFDRPLFGDAVTAGINGLLSRRMELVVRTSYTSGTVGLSARAPRFDSYIGSARLRRALSRRLAGYAEALFYHYAFEEGAPRPPGVPQTFNRVAIRCGISWWIPADSLLR